MNSEQRWNLRNGLPQDAGEIEQLRHVIRETDQPEVKASAEATLQELLQMSQLLNEAPTQQEQ